MAKLYSLIVDGRDLTSDDHRFQVLAKIFNSGPSAAKTKFYGKEVLVRRNISKAESDEILAQLLDKGVVARVEPLFDKLQASEPRPIEDAIESTVEITGHACRKAKDLDQWTKGGLLIVAGVVVIVIFILFGSSHFGGGLFVGLNYSELTLIDPIYEQIQSSPYSSVTKNGDILTEGVAIPLKYGLMFGFSLSALGVVFRILAKK